MHLIHPDTPACIDGDCLQGRRACPTPAACRYIAHLVATSPQPEAAHAACEYDDDDRRPVPVAGLVVWLISGIIAVLGIAAVWHALAGALL